MNNKIICLLTTLTIMGVSIVSLAQAQTEPGSAPVAIAIHAGAGTIKRGEFADSREQEIRAKLEQAVKAGYDLLASGASSLDAITEAITILEDSPFFNAARGAVFNADGKNELDSSIMDGANLNAGAVTGVHNIKNPILLAQKVMTDSVHVMLMGEGAEKFAQDHDIVFEDDEYFFTEYRWQQLQKARAEATGGDKTGSLYETPDQWFSTVGAVALDVNGNLAAGTSTGGMTNKRWGRVGDSPIIGAGTYADNHSCAVSATGHGEYFIRATVARDICARVQFTGVTLQEAADHVVMQQLVEMGGSGGIIAIDPQGNISLTYNTPGMYRASVDVNGEVTVAIFGDE